MTYDATKLPTAWGVLLILGLPQPIQAAVKTLDRRWEVDAAQWIERHRRFWEGQLRSLSRYVEG